MRLIKPRGRARCGKILAASSSGVDIVNTNAQCSGMAKASHSADVNIHLRARPQDRKLIDRAAELSGANRSQFMLASALKEAKSILLDQTTIDLDAKAFRRDEKNCCCQGFVKACLAVRPLLRRLCLSPRGMTWRSSIHASRRSTTG
jgi:uncharacterized protein (DUF1778 family)